MKDAYDVNAESLNDDNLFIIRDAATGVVTYEGHWLGNDRHRDPADGPAVIRRNAATGVITFEAYWLDGNLHREPADGPAMTSRNPVTGTVTRQEYWLNGQAVPAPLRPTASAAPVVSAASNAR